MSQTIDDLRRRCMSLDGRGYPKYKSLKGSYGASRIEFAIDHVQGDPFAEPSMVRAWVDGAPIPKDLLVNNRDRRAIADYVHRACFEGLRRPAAAGSGRSGEVRILEPGPQILERTAAHVDSSGRVELRFKVGLPARGRRILGDAAAELLCDFLPERILEILDELPPDQLRRHARCLEHSVALRCELEPRGWVAFIADGSILPRASGISSSPLEGAVPFVAPEGLADSVVLADGTRLRGLPIKQGVTLIVGGGYHGKSTLLDAIQLGIYDHIPGDGRESIVTCADAVKVRAEDGRSVASVDISSFIAELPGGRTTRPFSTKDASGSTSQAASMVEALELGATALLLDEDTSATNLLIRDQRMRELIPAEREPITPLIDRVRDLWDLQGVSTVMVVGGAGDYLDAADEIIAMSDYLAEDATARARAIVERSPRVLGAPLQAMQPPLVRRVDPKSIDARRGHKDRATKVHELDRAQFGTGTLELAAVEQLVERGQTRAIVEFLASSAEELGVASLPEALRSIEKRIAIEGLSSLAERPDGEWCSFRRYELGAALNRLRDLLITTPATD